MIDKESGIKIKHKLQIIEILKLNQRIEKVWLFGSRALGSFKESSDIDLVVEGLDLTLDDLAQLTTALEQTSIPYQIDLLVKHQISSAPLLEHIEKKGVRWI